MDRADVPDAPALTRRQLRERERGRATRRQARHDAPVSRHATSPGRGSRTGAPSSPAQPADEVATEILLPSRRALREERRSVRGRPTRWAPRAALLGTLGALTIVAPLTGFAATRDDEGEDPTPAEAHVQAVDVSALDVLATGAPHAETPASLLGDPAALTRATVLQTSRAAARETPTCDPVEGASGTLAAFTEQIEQQVVMPLAAGTYRHTSPYGYRNHPFGGYGLHSGTDFAAPLGTPIHAAAGGTVDYVGYGRDGRSSMIVVLRHEIEAQLFYTWYVHMYAHGIFVQEGEEVTAGQVIAEVGNNGNSTGPHLHFEVHTDDQLTTIEPLEWLREHGAVDVSELC